MGDVESKCESAQRWLWIAFSVVASACGGRSNLSREIAAGGAASDFEVGSTIGGTRPFGSVSTSIHGGTGGNTVSLSTVTSSMVTGGRSSTSAATGGRGSIAAANAGRSSIMSAAGNGNETGGAFPSSNLTSLGGASGGMRSDAGQTHAGTTHRAGAGGDAGTHFGPSAGVASEAGAGNSGHNATCSHHASLAGNAGAPHERVWYVDAQRGSDRGAGTVDDPLKTLSCAALAASASDTVRLLDGVWSLADELHLEHPANTCGALTNVTFAPNVNLRAVHPGAAKVFAADDLGLCVTGGIIEGIEVNCAPDRAALQTRNGTLQIIGSSLRNCQVFGLDIAGDAQVALLPGDLTDYAQVPNAQFARVRENAKLGVHGGKVSHQFGALSVEDAATLDLDGVTVEVQDHERYLNFVNAIAMRGASPTLVVRNQSVIRYASTAIYAYDTRVNIEIDGMTIADVATGLFLNVSGGVGRSKIDLNQLTITGASDHAIIAWGDWDFALRNSAILASAANTITLNGTGPTLCEHVMVKNGMSGFLLAGPANASGVPLEEGSALDVKFRDVAISGMQAAAVYILGMEGDRYDFGTAASPGGNAFFGNHLATTPPEANLVFTLFHGSTLHAVGNTWDANQQGANAAGQYVVQTTGVPLDVSGGTGPNYAELSDNRCYLRLAE